MWRYIYICIVSRVIFWKQIDKESQLGSTHTFRVSILSSFQGPFVVKKTHQSLRKINGLFLHQMHSPYIVTQRADQCYSDSDGPICWIISMILGGEKNMANTAMCVKKETDLDISFYKQYIPGRLSQDVKSIHPWSRGNNAHFPVLDFRCWITFQGVVEWGH